VSLLPIRSPASPHWHRTITSDGDLRSYMRGNRLCVGGRSFRRQLARAIRFNSPARAWSSWRVYQMTAIFKAGRSKRGSCRGGMGGKLADVDQSRAALHFLLDQAAGV